MSRPDDKKAIHDGLVAALEHTSRAVTSLKYTYGVLLLEGDTGAAERIRDRIRTATLERKALEADIELFERHRA